MRYACLVSIAATLHIGIERVQEGLKNTPLEVELMRSVKMFSHCGIEVNGVL
jgi:hypothetical protein